MGKRAPLMTATECQLADTCYSVEVPTRSRSVDGSEGLGSRSYSGEFEFQRRQDLNQFIDSHLAVKFSVFVGSP